VLAGRGNSPAATYGFLPASLNAGSALAAILHVRRCVLHKCRPKHTESVRMCVSVNVRVLPPPPCPSSRTRQKIFLLRRNVAVVHRTLDNIMAATKVARVVVEDLDGANGATQVHAWLDAHEDDAGALLDVVLHTRQRMRYTCRRPLETTLTWRGRALGRRARVGAIVWRAAARPAGLARPPRRGGKHTAAAARGGGANGAAVPGYPRAPMGPARPRRRHGTDRARAHACKPTSRSRRVERKQADTLHAQRVRWRGHVEAAGGRSVGTLVVDADDDVNDTSWVPWPATVAHAEVAACRRVPWALVHVRAPGPHPPPLALLHGPPIILHAYDPPAAFARTPHHT
jgi:hypothetical protein